jgi:hypothetical protein
VYVPSRSTLRRLHTLVDGSNSIRQILIALPRHQKPGVADHAAELLLARELGNALDKILVAIAVAGNELANERDGGEAPALVDGVEERVVHLAELEAGEDAAGLEDAVGLAQGDILVGEVADAEGDRVQVDAGVGDHAEVLCVCLDEAEARRARVRRRQRALLALGQHGRVDVGDGHARVRVVVDVRGVVEHAERDVARAAGDVEDAHARGAGHRGQRVAAWVEVAHEMVFPEAVDAEGHEVVHRVVRRGDGREDGADWACVSVGVSRRGETKR